MGTLRGLTWDHPRGYRALDAVGPIPDDIVAAGAVPGSTAGEPVSVAWDRQSLADFESRPLREVVGEFDLLVVDHPGLGEAIADDALVPVEQVLGPDLAAAICARTVGRSAASYHLDGRQWALPLDAATQVAVVVEGVAEPPATWSDAAALARSVPSTLCLGGPHALLMLEALCSALGQTTAEADELVDPAIGAAAWPIMQDLFAVCDPVLSLKAPLAVLDALATASGNSPAYCPLVYGYLPYQSPVPRARALRAGNAPAAITGGRIGSVLGGTGLAVSRPRSGDPGHDEAVRRVLVHLLSPAVQVQLFSDHGGQAALRTAWEDPEIDARWHGFYRKTRASIEQAWIRPRAAGWLAVQGAAAAVVRTGLVERHPGTRVVECVNAMYRRHIGQAERE